MLRRFLCACRAHPIAAAAILGALIGAGNAIAIEIGTVPHFGSGGVLPLLWSSSTSRTSQLNPAQAAALLLIEFSANVLVMGFLFATPVALIVAVRRAFAGPRRSAAPSEADPPDRPTPPRSA